MEWNFVGVWGYAVMAISMALFVAIIAIGVVAVAHYAKLGRSRTSGK
ncbi:hypothetical protein BKA01_007802 [Pseudonocardia eucalypti]|nr:hypothetical protein [Pseudonocardia eucalypti]